MAFSLHETSVPVFLRYLERLRGLVDAAEEFESRGSGPPGGLLGARLAPDMLPFETQVAIAAHFALRACHPLAGQPVPPFGDHPATPDGLRARIARAESLLCALDPAAFADAESRMFESRAGDALVRLAGPAFLLQYALPNFFFHLTTAYAILRAAGVPLGKADFDGFHVY